MRSAKTIHVLVAVAAIVFGTSCVAAAEFVFPPAGLQGRFNDLQRVAGNSTRIISQSCSPAGDCSYAVSRGVSIGLIRSQGGMTSTGLVFFDQRVPDPASMFIESIYGLALSLSGDVQVPDVRSAIQQLFPTGGSAHEAREFQAGGIRFAMKPLYDPPGYLVQLSPTE